MNAPATISGRNRSRLRDGRGWRVRWAWIAAAVAVVALAEVSPIRILADGVLFSAHMVQHLLLLLVAPALLIRGLKAPAARHRSESQPGMMARRAVPVLGWPAGVGAMWLWHVPALCDASIAVPAVHALQSLSLLACGTLFWWPILAPRAADRLHPGIGIGYLFTACLACSALGMLITLTPIEVCSAFTTPLGATDPWASWRARLGVLRDRQIGGLLMWVPTCSIYVGAIMLELARLFSGRDARAAEEAR